MNRLIEKLTFFIVAPSLVPNGYRGITIGPFVFTRDKAALDCPRYRQHEKIHVCQFLECTILSVLACISGIISGSVGLWVLLLCPFTFYLLYGLMFLVLYFRKNNWNKAYRTIPFESEAYRHQNTENYFENRSLFAWEKWVVRLAKNIWKSIVNK